MADNFNLRQFLSENKLTKNAKLLKEEQEQAPIQGLNLVVLDDNEGGEITLEKYSDMDDEFQQIFNDGLEEGEWEATSLEQGLAELDEYFEEQGDPSQQEDYDAKKQQFQSAVQGKAGKFYVHGVEYDLQLMFIEEQGGEGEIEEAAPASMQAGFDMVDANKRRSIELRAIANELFPEFGGELKNLGDPLTPEQRDAVWDEWAKTQVVAKRDDRMKESKLTAKERRLVEMVQDALGIEEEHQNADPNVPNDSTGMAIDMMKNGLPEGEEMVREKAIPTYESIEDLMKEIEEGTNLVAEKHKIQEMKRIAERLRAEAKKMEESEHAQHINPKVLKKYLTDAKKIEDAAQKLSTALEKASGNKKPAAEKEEQKVEALQEERLSLRSKNTNSNTMKNFDLKKFLTENRLTTNSRTVVKENSDMGEKMQFFMEFMEQYAAGMPEADILEMLEDSYDIPQNVNMQVLERATSQLDLVINDIYTAIFESDNY